MTTIGAFEAKNHLSELLARTAAGEEFVITNRGKAVARLVPPADAAPDPARVVRELLAARDESGPILGPGLTVRDLIDDGRSH